MTNTQFSSTPTPLTPPKLEEDRLSWLRLFRSRKVGVATFYRLLHEHGSAQAALAALPELARAAGVNDYTPCTLEQAQTELRQGLRAKARLVCRGDAEYPASLAQTDDAPPLFWATGNLSLLQRPMIAVVGARNASSLGERMTKALAGALAEAGFVVVSGLARGIDAAAHGAALHKGTIAVLAGGVDTVYPQENRNLFHDIGRQGLRLSEQAMGLTPHSRHFPPRNRIISGLSLGLVVVEAAARSGSLITANNALDQGREVMAIPGHPFDARASGCNMLIRDGATLVRGADDVIAALNERITPDQKLATNWREQAELHKAPLGLPDTARTPPPSEARKNNRTAANGRHPPAPVSDRPQTETRGLHQKILSRLGPSPVAEDQLIRDLGIEAADLSPLLLSLELEGDIQRHVGGMVSRRP